MLTRGFCAIFASLIFLLPAPSHGQNYDFLRVELAKALHGFSESEWTDLKLQLRADQAGVPAGLWLWLAEQVSVAQNEPRVKALFESTLINSQVANLLTSAVESGSADLVDALLTNKFVLSRAEKLIQGHTSMGHTTAVLRAMILANVDSPELRSQLRSENGMRAIAALCAAANDRGIRHLFAYLKKYPSDFTAALYGAAFRPAIVKNLPMKMAPEERSAPDARPLTSVAGWLAGWLVDHPTLSVDTKLQLQILNDLEIRGRGSRVSRLSAAFYLLTEGREDFAQTLRQLENARPPQRLPWPVGAGANFKKLIRALRPENIEKSQQWPILYAEHFWTANTLRDIRNYFDAHATGANANDLLRIVTVAQTPDIRNLPGVSSFLTSPSVMSLYEIKLRDTIGVAVLPFIISDEVVAEKMAPMLTQTFNKKTLPFATNLAKALKHRPSQIENPIWRDLVERALTSRDPRVVREILDGLNYLASTASPAARNAAFELCHTHLADEQLALLQAQRALLKNAVIRKRYQDHQAAMAPTKVELAKVDLVTPSVKPGMTKGEFFNSTLLSYDRQHLSELIQAPHDPANAPFITLLSNILKDERVLDYYLELIQKAGVSKKNLRVLALMSIDHPLIDKTLIRKKLGALSPKVVNAMVMGLVSAEWTPTASEQDLAKESAMRRFLNDHLAALLPQLDSSARLQIRMYATDWTEMQAAIAHAENRTIDKSSSGAPLDAQDVQRALAFTSGHELPAAAVFQAFALHELPASAQDEFLKVADANWVTSAFQKLSVNTNADYRLAIVAALNTSDMVEVVASALSKMDKNKLRGAFRLALSPEYSFTPLSISIRELLSRHTEVLKARLAEAEFGNFDLRKMGSVRSPEAAVVSFIDGVLGSGSPAAAERLTSNAKCEGILWQVAKPRVHPRIDS